MEINSTNKPSFSLRSATFLFSVLFVLATFMASGVAVGASDPVSDHDSLVNVESNVREDNRAEIQALILGLDDEEYETEEERLRALEKRAREYKKLADDNHSAGMAAYGACLEYGIGVEKNLSLAVEYYKRAADLGSEAGCLYYGRSRLYGIGCARDGKEAVKYLLRIANPSRDDTTSDGYSVSSFLLRNLADVFGAFAPCSVLVQTAVYEGNNSGDFSSISDAARGGSPTAQQLLAEHYANAGDPAESLRWSKLAAYGGEDQAMKSLANYYKDQGISSQEERWLFERTIAGGPGSALGLGAFYARQSKNNNLTQQEKDRYKGYAEVWLGLAAALGDGNEAAEMYRLVSEKTVKKNETLKTRTTKKKIREWKESWGNEVVIWQEWLITRYWTLRWEEWQIREWEKLMATGRDNGYLGNYRYPTTNSDGLKTDYHGWGFFGEPKEITLEKGTMLQRYSTPRNKDDLGQYLAPLGTPFRSSSLPEEQKNARFRAFEVVKPFSVLSGLSGPWSEQPGMGVQFLTIPKNDYDKINSETSRENQIKMENDLSKEYGVDSLIAKGYIREVYRMEDRNGFINSDKYPGE